MVGNSAANYLHGNDGYDKLYGGSGNDTLIGGNSYDDIHGQYGNDALYGGAGDDYFIFDTALNAASNKDNIADFSTADGDLIRLDNDVFTSLGYTGTLSATDFKSVTNWGQVDSTDHIIYWQSSGNLYYDPDGSGTASAVMFATLSNKPTIDNTDFYVIA